MVPRARIWMMRAVHLSAIRSSTSRDGHCASRTEGAARAHCLTVEREPSGFTGTPRLANLTLAVLPAALRTMASLAPGVAPMSVTTEPRPVESAVGRPSVYCVPAIYVSLRNWPTFFSVGVSSRLDAFDMLSCKTIPSEVQAESNSTKDVYRQAICVVDC